MINDNRIQILDGGMGRELLRIGAPFAQPEWSALALMNAPEMVTQAHRNFIDAGAEIITTNAYALVPFHIGQGQDVEGLARLAVQCVKDAISNTPSSCGLTKGSHASHTDPAIESQDNILRIAGCIPPAFGSYKPELFLPAHLSPILTPLIQAQKNDVDFWLMETMSSMHEAMAVIELIRTHSDLPIYTSFTLNNRADLMADITLRSGEYLDTLEPILTKIDAVLFNCSQPEEMEGAIKAVRTMNKTIPIGAYANNFSEIKRTKNANEGISESRDDITPEKYLNFAQKWVDAGATIIGGCCGITPDHIALLNQSFKAHT